MKPYKHALSSVKKYGGEVEDYLDIHTWFDQSKAFIADHRHRCLLHNAWGIFMAESVFGATRTNSEGKVYSVRDVGEDHVLQDLGRIPTLVEILELLPHEKWMGGPIRGKKVTSLEELFRTVD